MDLYGTMGYTELSIVSKLLHNVQIHAGDKGKRDGGERMEYTESVDSLPLLLLDLSLSLLAQFELSQLHLKH